MTINTLEPMFTDNEAATLEEQKLGAIDSDQASAAMHATMLLPERRCEGRVDYRRLCPYKVIEVKDGKSVIIGQGEAFALNQSKGGMLLLIDLAPRSKQLIEVHTRRSGWGWSLNVLEAKWAKPVQVESLGNLYLVGCRRVFGSCNYLSF